MSDRYSITFYSLPLISELLSVIHFCPFFDKFFIQILLSICFDQLAIVIHFCPFLDKIWYDIAQRGMLNSLTDFSFWQLLLKSAEFVSQDHNDWCCHELSRTNDFLFNTLKIEI